MDSLGNRFRTARESQGLTLEQMVAKTRIQEAYLKALEEDAFGQLPAQVFAKGFVRSYARSLNLDEEECLRLFVECSASFYRKERKGPQKKTFLKEDGHRRRPNRVLVVLLVAGLFLLGGLALFQQQSPVTSVVHRFLQQTGEPRDRALPEPTTDVTGIPEEPPVDDEASTSVPSAEQRAGDPGVPNTESASTGAEEDPLVLELRTAEMTWVVVRSDENDPQEALLQVGETAKWRARERFLLTLGNAGGVEIRLNGKLRGPFGAPGVVVREVELRP